MSGRVLEERVCGSVSVMGLEGEELWSVRGVVLKARMLRRDEWVFEAWLVGVRRDVARRGDALRSAAQRRARCRRA